MAVKALKYKLLSKGLLNLPDEVTNLVSGKLAIRCCNECSVQSITASPRHTGPPVALAAKARILADSSSTTARCRWTTWPARSVS